MRLSTSYSTPVHSLASEVDAEHLCRQIGLHTPLTTPDLGFKGHPSQSQLSPHPPRASAIAGYTEYHLGIYKPDWLPIAAL